MSTPSFNRSEVEAHVSLLHDLAEGIDGILILAAFEEGGQPRVQRFGIGDVATMVETIMAFDGHPRVNLYSPWCVMRRDLEPDKKGREADVIAVLAAVPDLDNDKYTIGELPIEAPYIVESSPGNFQPVYPLPPLEAKPVLTAICDFVGGDSATKDCSHVWRIPGTVNIPTKSKLARGRSPVPAPVTIKKHYDGGFVSPAALLALAPAPRRPNGYDTAPSRPLSFAEKARLCGALVMIPAGERRTWLVVGMALHTVRERAVYDEWSKTSDKFDADEQEKAWASFNDDHEPRVTVATLYHMAREHGWRPSEPFFERTGEPQAFVPKYKNLAVFIREYQPISYTLEGILPSSVFYFLTARRSTGKTAFLVAALFAIILGNTELLGVRVKKGRVAYVALENPTDLRMKLEVARFHFGGGVPLDDLADMVTIIDARLPVAEIVAQLNVAGEELGHFQVVLWDTFQAGFQGEEFNDNAGILKYAQQLRTLTGLPGRPSVLVAAHPTKNAGEGELIPYGGGSSINEADGNLTLWAEDGSIKLHFNRVRGPEFEPRYFRIEKLSCPDIVDDEGRQILLPALRPVSEQVAEQRKAAKGTVDLEVLKSLAEVPSLTERERALKLGVPRTTLQRRLAGLVKRKFVEQGANDCYRLTPKGRKEILTVV